MPERVLLVRFGAIGDIVMALPAAATVKSSDPGADVFWFVDTRFRDLVRGQANVDEVFEFDRGKFRGRAMNPATWRAQMSAYLAPRSLKPTTAIDLQGHSKTALAIRFSGAKRKFVLDPKDPLAAGAGTAVNSEAGTHMVERYLAAVGAAGFGDKAYSFSLPVRQEDRDWVQVRVGNTPYMTVHLGGTHPKKVWPVDRFIEAAGQIAPTRLLVVGGPDESTLSTVFCGRMVAESLVGQTTLMQLAEVLRRSRLHLSGDTGTAHIAASYGTPCITVFGHMPPTVYHPWGQPGAVVESGGDVLNVTPETVHAKYREIGVAA